MDVTSIDKIRFSMAVFLKSIADKQGYSDEEVYVAVRTYIRNVESAFGETYVKKLECDYAELLNFPDFDGQLWREV